MLKNKVQLFLINMQIVKKLLIIYIINSYQFLFQLLLTRVSLFFTFPSGILLKHSFSWKVKFFSICIADTKFEKIYFK